MKLTNTLKKRVLGLLFFVAFICFIAFFFVGSSNVVAVSDDSIIYNFNNTESTSSLTKRYQTESLTYENGAIKLELNESKVSGNMDGFGYDISLGENEFSYEEYPYIRYDFKFNNCYSGTLVEKSGTPAIFGAQLFTYNGDSGVVNVSYNAGNSDGVYYSVLLDLKDFRYYLIGENNNIISETDMNLSTTYKIPYYNVVNAELKTINKISLNIVRINKGYAQDLSAECQYFGVFSNLDTALAFDGSVAKIGSNSYRFIEDAFNAVKTGETIKLTENVELNNELSITEDVTLDLNGKTISFNGETTISGKLTVVDTVGGGSAKFKKEPVLFSADSLVYEDSVSVKIPKKIIYNFNNTESTSSLTKRYQTESLTYENGAIKLELNESKVSGNMDGFGYDLALGENAFSYEEYPYIRYDFKFNNCYGGTLESTSDNSEIFGAQIYTYNGGTEIVRVSYNAGSQDGVIYSVLLDLKEFKYYLIGDNNQIITETSMNLSSTYKIPYYSVLNTETTTIDKVSINIVRINRGYTQDLSAECQYFGVFSDLDTALAFDGSSVAVDGNNYRDLGQAIENAESGATISAKDNVYADTAVAIVQGKELTIDLKGKDFVFNNDFAVNGNLKIVDTVGTGSVTFNSELDASQGALSISGGKYNKDVSEYLENGYGVKQESGKYLVSPLGVKIYGATISTQGNIGVKFAINETDVRTDISNASIIVSVNETESVFNLSDITPDSNDYYVVKVDVSAKQMTDEITIKLDNNGVIGKTYSYSVQEYAVRKINDEESSKELKDFLKAMLNYGAATQEYFGYNQGDLANAVLEETDKNISLDGITSYTDSSYERKLDGSITGLSVYGATVSLNSETAIKIAFRASELDLTNLSFNIKTKDSESAIYSVAKENGEYKIYLTENNGYKNTVELSKDGEFYILKIDNIVAKDLHSIQSINILNADASESMEIKYGVFSYAKDNYNKSDALKKLFDAMLVYNSNAVDYVG